LRVLTDDGSSIQMKVLIVPEIELFTTN